MFAEDEGEEIASELLLEFASECRREEETDVVGGDVVAREEESGGKHLLSDVGIPEVDGQRS